MIDGIDFSVVVSKILMIPLSDYPVFLHDDDSYHGIRTDPGFSFFASLRARLIKNSSIVEHNLQSINILHLIPCLSRMQRVNRKGRFLLLSGFLCDIGKRGRCQLQAYYYCFNGLNGQHARLTKKEKEE
jgi:hypothetical protein